MCIRKRLYSCKTHKFLFVLLLFFCPLFLGFGQTLDAVQYADFESDTFDIETLSNQNEMLLQTNENDTTNIELPADTVPPPPRGNHLDARIEYSSQDSIVFLRDGTVFLHGAGDMTYQNIRLQAEFIRVNMESSILFARGVTDSIGDVIGEPLFSEGGEEYHAQEIRYNLRTGRGYVTNAVTQQGEGYIISRSTKKTESNMLAVAGAKYTTCDNHCNPHFYLYISRGKIKPGEHVVAGPSRLVIADVPIPITIPFGFFPFSTQYSSGFLMPSFMDELNRGFGLINGGYYFAFNDFVDLELRTEFWTRGTWAASATSSYIRRYRFSGNVNVNYRVDVMGERDMPDYRRNQSLNITWSHRQDPRANPFRVLSANVNFMTNMFNQNNIHTYNNPQINSQNTVASSVTLTQRFPNIAPLSIQGGVQVTQVMSDSTIDLQLPNMTVAVSRIFPFRQENRVGRERWFEKIMMSYTGTLENRIRTREDELFSSTFRDWNTGMRHSIPISAVFNVFNHINITPSITYNERWHTSSFQRRWDDATNSVAIDTIYGFNRNFDFNANVTAQTRLYGFYVPSRRIFGDRVDRIRHVMTPSIGIGYSPDFSTDFWGFFGSYIEPDPLGTYPGWREVSYSRFQGTRFGGPGAGQMGNINFRVANNLEMKVRNDRDETGQNPFRIISLIDDFSLSGNYNLLADSMNLSNINATLRFRVNNRTLNLSGVFDPYMYKIDSNGRVYRSRDYTWQHGMFPHFLGTQAAYTLRFDNAWVTRLGERLSRIAGFGEEVQLGNGNGSNGYEDEDTEAPSAVDRRVRTRTRADVDGDGFERVNIPWSLNVSYSVNYRRSGNFNEETMRYRMEFMHNLQLSASVALTQNWRFTGNTSYDFLNREFTQMNINVIRNLHCWTMTASFVPFGRFKSYHFRIGVNASMLQDLKFERQTRGNSNPIVWY